MCKVFLIGFMGSGKSTLGMKLAEQLKFSFLETDQLIEQREQKKITEIFRTKGESYFRLKEKEVLNHLQLVDRCVIATGGGMPCVDNHMDLMNQLGITIWLDVDEEILLERLQHESSNRPLLTDAENLEMEINQLLSDRRKYYLKATHRIKNPNSDTLFHLIQSIQVNNDTSPYRKS